MGLNKGLFGGSAPTRARVSGGSFGGGGLSVSLFEIEELRQVILDLPKHLQSRTLRRVLKKQTNIVLAEIKAVMPLGTAPEHLRHELKSQAGKTTNKGEMIRHGVGFPTRDELGIDASDLYYYPFAVEFGHAAPGRGSYAGQKPGKPGEPKAKRVNKNPPKDVAARPYIRNSWDRKESMMAANIEADTWEAIKALWEGRIKRGFKGMGREGAI